MPRPQTPAENFKKADILAALEQQAKAKRGAKLRSFVPYPKQAEFIAATRDHREVCLRAGNQQGKSECAGYYVSVAATGMYPDGWQGRVWPGPIRAWAAGESTTACRDINQRKLCGPPGDDALLGTGFLPKDTIVKTILGHGAGGAFDKILVRHTSGGTSEITFKSYDQERGKWQGESLDLLWCDEEPPIDLYNEGLARLIATDGTAISTFTPLSGMNGVLPRFAERSAEAMRNRALVAMKMDDAEHLKDPKRREALLATFAPHERRARIDGLPSLGSGAVFEGVEIEDLMTPLRLIGGEIVHPTLGVYEAGTLAKLWGIDFGILHPFAAVLIGWDRDTDTIYVLAEVRIRGGVPEIHAARMRAIASNVKVAWPHDGTQRDKGSGEQLASQYKAQGLNMLPTHATHPTGGFSTEPGIADMLSRMLTGRLKISVACHELVEELQSYHRKDGLIVKVNDDLISALRIACMQIRSASDVPLGSQIKPRGGGQGYATGHDDDPFDWGRGPVGGQQQ